MSDRIPAALLRETERELDRPQKVDHRASWRDSPPPAPGWATRVVRKHDGGPDPLPMPRTPKK